MNSLSYVAEKLLARSTSIFSILLICLLSINPQLQMFYALPQSLKAVSAVPINHLLPVMFSFD